MKKILSLLALTTLTTLSQAVTYTDTFSGPLSGDWSLWNGDGVNSILAINGSSQLEYTGDTGDVGGGLGTATAYGLRNSTVLPADSDWTLQVDLSLAAAAAFAGLENGDVLILGTLGVRPESSSQNAAKEFNFGKLESTNFGSPGFQNVVRTASRSDNGIDDVSDFSFAGDGALALNGTMYLTYYSATGELISGYDIGSGIVSFSDPVDTNAWNLDANTGFLFNIDGNIFNPLQTPPPANFTVDPGEFLFDNVIVSESTLVSIPVVPEPSAFAMIFGMASLLVAVRRRS